MMSAAVEMFRQARARKYSTQQRNIKMSAPGSPSQAKAVGYPDEGGQESNRAL